MRNDWIKIKNYYLSHEISLEDLAKRYKCSMSAVKSHCRKEGWVAAKSKKATEIDQKVCQRIIEQEINRKVKANEKHNELYDKGLEVAELLLNAYLTELKSGKKSKRANAYNLDFIMKAIANAQKGQRQALNIASDDVENVEPEVRIINGIDLKQI